MVATKTRIIYPIFLECIPFAEEGFWKELLEHLSYGVCPRNTYINKGFICSRLKGREFSYNVEPEYTLENRDEVLGKFVNKFIRILKNKLNIISERERNSTKLRINSLDITDTVKKWSSIRKLGIKNTIIHRYILDKKRQYNLKSKAVTTLISIVFIGFLLNTITTDSIIYENGIIEDINGITFKNSKVMYSEDLTTFPRTDINIEHVNVSPEKKSITSGWDKFIAKLTK
jgi:hypothetical protein